MPSFEELSILDLHIHFFVDTNFPDDPSVAATYLRKMRDDHRVRLTLASVGEEELNKSRDLSVRDLATDHDVALGVGLDGETRWGRGADASDEDARQQAAILAILTSTGAGEEKMRNDARHLQTALRYVVDKFITRDGGILNKAEVLADEFGLKVMEPEAAAALVVKRDRE